MKNPEKLTHKEVMTTLSDSLRDLAAMSYGDRNLVMAINKGKALASIVTAIHREEIIESKRNNGLNAIKSAEPKKLKS